MLEEEDENHSFEDSNRDENENDVDDVFEEIKKENVKLQELAMNIHNSMPTRSLPKQEYLQATVLPLVIEGMSWVLSERPEDPVENLAMFLIKNNPNTPEIHTVIDTTEYEVSS
ncbi:Dpy-30 motif family protein [Tritrichomonas foetus]|uniref:Dpy-30 motif family protein n=1 Tax=Tritrichomonas foetus TaxID=1144522 RepID=A0A1J4L0E8_9EUKA|nr:Dpy-30 motif family protein [Tritrichomonas foetus]|eukprot:OHT16608.1 Dpy-30 motif family protein [Tritrichomonas foetus]